MSVCTTTPVQHGHGFFQALDLKENLLSYRVNLLRRDGHPGLVIYMWDSDCPVSQRYLPRLAEIEKQYAARNVRFVYVDVAPHDRAQSLARAGGDGLAGKAVRDERKLLASALRPTSAAEVFYVDARRTLRFRGAIDDQYTVLKTAPKAREAYLTDAIESVAAGGQPLVAQTEGPGCLLSPSPAHGHPAALTYHNRISRIIQQHCEECHREKGLGPMPLETFAQVYERRHMLQYMMSTRRMPPWPPDESGAPLVRDRSVPERDIRAFNQWVALGAPEGEAAQAPLPRKWTDGWTIGPPDAILQIPDAFRIPAQGYLDYQYSYIHTNFREDKWIKAVEIKPTSRRVLHHALVFVDKERPPGTERTMDELQAFVGFLAGTGMGASGVVFPEGSGKKIPKGAVLMVVLHYQPNGKEQTDQTAIGLKFADGPVREISSRAAFEMDLAIPPHAPHHKAQAFYRFEEDGALTNVFPHMHLRGAAIKYELQDPDGKSTVLLDLKRYNANWQAFYDMKRPVDVHAGSVLNVTAFYDNSSSNPLNPDPSVTVNWGPQTFNEMLTAYFDFIAAPKAPAGMLKGK